MTPRLLPWLTALALITVLATPGRVAAQPPKAVAYPYIMIDIGTLGGPTVSFNPPGQIVNNQGTVLAAEDTPITHTTCPSCDDPYTFHAVAWHGGVLTDLGALPGNNNSVPFEANARGDIVGTSSNGVIDPLRGNPESRAVLWKDGRIINLGTLGGNESWGNWINNRDQIVGWATNTLSDPFALTNFDYALTSYDFQGGQGTQMRAVLWQDGRMRELGTLGGPDSDAFFINDRGQIAGNSFTTAISNTVTGEPTEDIFLWQDGHMRDLGTLGGTLSNPSLGPTGLNEQGEVTGDSTLAGDLYFHPFLWDGHSMRDLGTLGGDFGYANSINEAGDVVGLSTLSGDAVLPGFLWKNGALTNLGVLPGATWSAPDSINAEDQIVGGSGNDGWLWEHHTLYDLNTLVAPSALQIGYAPYINDRGEIAALANLANGDVHMVLLIPTALAASEGLVSNALPASRDGRPTVTRRSVIPCMVLPGWRARPIRVRLSAEMCTDTP